uniref:non-specific serine/threonine protein kinase n=1 Tax=Chenopodium quinoa TaxID=63459 RepID=A0A803MWZ4_CHEQI
MNHSLMLAAGNTYYRCYTTGNFSSDSQYIQTRNSLLSALADGVKDQGGFYRFTAGVYPPTPVPDCLGLCRKDLISSDDCYDCISKSASDLSQNCPVQKQIVAWGADADCMVQCIPPATLKPQKDDTYPSEHACNATGVSAVNLSRFGGTLANVTAKLAFKVAAEGTSSSFPSGYNEPQYFATEEAKFGDRQTIYAGGYCLPSLSASGCTACLNYAANQSDKYCNGKSGASIFTPGCALRFELYPFYKSTKSVAASPPVSPSSNTRKKSRANNRIAVFTIILPIISVVTLLVLIIGTRMILKRRKQHWDHKDDIVGAGSIESCFEFSFKTIRSATNDFSESNKLGQGGFGVVYRGKASKWPASCDPHRRENLTWKIRFNIIEGITRGLLYLHEESQLRIIHRDLKASNILLDAGYMPPEYAKYGKISTKVDVFSFGVLLLEIVTGRKNSASDNPRRLEHLLSKAWKCWKEGQLLELIDPMLLREDGQVNDITRCIHIGLLCVQENVGCRPIMKDVVLVLEGCSQSLPSLSEPAYLMEIVSGEPSVSTMEKNLASRSHASDTDQATSGLSSLSSAGFTSAGDLSSSWVSPSKDFAFGFQEIQPGNFLLAIWFNQIPEKTIAWCANRDHLVLSGSKVEFTTDKGLTLTNSDGLEIWRAKLVSNGSSDGERLSYAAILDTGNFILANQASAILWQSFDEPTDTLLPTQVLNLGGQLISPRNGSIVTDMFSNELSEKQVIYQRVILEFDGVLRHYVYKNSSSITGGGWSIKSFAPDNICTAVIQQTGSGVCGYNSYCKLEYDSKPHCICPSGYTVLDPEDEMSGCFQSFLPQSCDKTTPENNRFDFKMLKDVDWPLSDYEHFQNVSIDWCREACLADCFCAVGIFRKNGDCWKKKLPLSNGKNDRSVDRTTFIKVRISSGFKERRYNRVKKVLTALLATSGSANIVLLGTVIGFYFFAHRKKPKVSGNYSVRSFRYKELNEATNGFNEELGRGAFGVVYKGFISDQLGTQTPIAVKKLDALSQNADKEFKAEVNSIGHTHHKNLVKLVGFCEEEEHRMLVYEFMSNGTLSDFLYQPPKPTWEKRLRIAQGIARGLFYLHEDCSTQVIHCDIKPQNILLDDDHNARISDFGLAKLLRLDQTQTNTAPRGTRGYVAPEWFKNMPITAKVDVYSIGILLLEIICCQRNVQGENNEEEGVFLLTDWAFDCYQMETIDELVKDDTEALNDKKRLERMVKICIWCIQEDPCLRPTMRRVVEMLEGLVQVPEPPCPTSYSTSETT